MQHFAPQGDKQIKNRSAGCGCYVMGLIRIWLIGLMLCVWVFCLYYLLIYNGIIAMLCMVDHIMLSLMHDILL